MFTSDLNAYAQLRAANNGMVWQPAGGVFAIEGTVYPGAPWPVVPITDNEDGWWAGFASGALGELVNIADGLWYVESVGYPAATTPMIPSATIGQHNLGMAIRVFADQYRAAFGSFPPIVCIGWSQGTMAIDMMWNEDVVAEDGFLHDLLPFFYRCYEYGEPMRAEGISAGDARAGFEGPGKMYGKTTAGVGGTKYNMSAANASLVAPDGVPVINSFNNPGDLYGAAPSPSVEAGKVEAGFADMIFQGKVKIMVIAGDLFHVVGDVEAGFNTLKFFAQGPNAPHYHYQAAMDFTARDLLALGLSLPHQLGL